MKLSFVISAHNEEKFIGRCLESIKKQLPEVDFDSEIIVVNNASTDSTPKVVQSFAGVLLINEPRKGLTYARQAGFKASSGEIIANLDADTILTNNWLKTVVREFKKNPNLAGLSGPFIYYDLSLPANLLVRVFYYFGYISYLINRYILRLSSMLQGGNVVVRRSALQKIGGFNLEVNFYGEDTDLARRLQAIGPTKFTFRLPMYSSGRRLHKEGVTRTGLRYVINYVWEIIFHKPFSNSHNDIRPNDLFVIKTTTDRLMRYLVSIQTTAVVLGLLLLGGFTYMNIQISNSNSILSRIKQNTLVFEHKWHNFFDDEWLLNDK